MTRRSRIHVAIGSGLLTIVLLSTMAMTACARRTARGLEQATAVIRSTVHASRRPAYVTADADGARLWRLTRAFYERRRFEPAWSERLKPTPRMTDLIAALRSADRDGLDSQLYNVTQLDQRQQDASRGLITSKGLDPEEAGSLDVWLTYVYLRHSSDLADGLSDLAHADPTWQIRPKRFDPRASLEEAIAKNDVASSLHALTPAHTQYRELRRVLADYRAMATKGGWPKVPNTTLKPGQRSPLIAFIAKRLAASGDYAQRVADGDHVYDAELVESVKRFQRRHGLADDGVVSAAVVAEMNIPVEDRIAQVQLNLERWRWLPRELGTRHILVNVPEYRLEVWEDGRVPVTMRTVVGKQDTPTPIFNDVMTHIVFSPYWNVPPNIAEGETVPAALRDPGFLERQNMEIVDASGKTVDPGSLNLEDSSQYRFRQRPGAGNALGLVKFMFPNQFNVYLHDTPAGSLFGRAIRSFSHGCVRLEEPKKLAQYVLRDQPEWTAERIEEAMHASEEHHVRLTHPIPVYLGYWTARVSADGIVQFRKDLYGIDARQAKLLADRLSRLRKSSAAAVSALAAPARPGHANGSSMP